MVKKRLIDRTKVHQQDAEIELFNFTFDEGYSYFLSAKKSEGLRKRTIESYEEHYHFFMNWLKGNYPK